MKIQSKINKRIFLLLIAKLFLFFVLLFRMLFLQIKENLYFSKLSDKNKTSYIPLIPKRGLILDNFNAPIAQNLLLWEALIIKSQIKQNLDLFINTIASIIVLTNADKEKIIKDVKIKPAHYPVLIKQNLSDSEIAAIETFSYNIPGIFIRPFYKRYYPYSETFANILGYTALSDSMEKNQNIPNWHLGKNGLELVLDPFLKGEAGYSKYEINAHGNIIKKLDQIPTKVGYNVALTIDLELQKKAYELLQQYNSGSACVVDLTTGNILTLASYPNFNPNLFSEGISNTLWSELISNPKAPLLNKPLSGMYPPGSTIKPMIALEALQKNLITLDTKITCKGYIDVGTDRFHCWHREGHGEVNVEQALYLSCDVFFYELSKKMKSSDINNVAKNFGFGAKHLPLMPSESSGKLLEDDLRLGERIISIIGQGKWLATPMQLLKMISLIATKGKGVNFNILKNIDYKDKIVYPKPKLPENKIATLYNEEYLEIIKKSFYNTVNLSNATGIVAKTYDKNWILNGKTGTSQVRRITKKERLEGILANHELPWHLRDHALFVSFVPYDSPLYAISVVIEHGGGGSTVAAPIAKELALLLRDRSKLIQDENNKINTILNMKKN
jgi:penicillin-binding protein 2